MNQNHELFLAALLSDIGLVKEYSDQGTSHPEASLQFFQIFSDKIQEFDLDTELVSSLIERHHETSEECLERILRRANTLVLGVEDEPHPASREWKEAPTPAFVSIFSKLYPTSDSPEVKFLPAKALTLQSSQFPVEQVQQASLVNDYNRLWENLMQEAEALPTGSFAALQISLVSLLKKYLSRVPATKTIGTPNLHSQEDVSLFERCRLTAALATCMASLSESEEELDELEDGHREVAQLISGDLSGIQSFIYTITSVGVSKGVRGRSFYLQLLSDAIARYVLTSLDSLPDVNLLYSGGGHFYILAPPEAAADIRDIRTHINETMLNHHQGNIYCALASCPLMLEDFYQADLLSEKWGEQLISALSSEKRRKFRDISVDEYEHLFSLSDHFINHPCQICTREEISNTEKNIGSFCESFEKLGDELGRSDREGDGYLIQASVKATSEVSKNARGYLKVLSTLGTSYELTKAADVHMRVTHLARNDATDIQVVRLNNTTFLENLELPSNVGRGFRFLGNVTPWTTGWLPNDKQRKGKTYIIKDFSELADASEGIARWGVLRMDIDNLGTLFREGFQLKEEGKSEPTSFTSLARITTLSDQISLFFEGYLNQIVGKYNRFTADKTKTDQLYILYSGGDDLFIVGSWDKLIEVAEDIRTQFRQYVCQNPKVTLSGGFSIHRKKYPLYKAAEVAKNALDDAKASEMFWNGQRFIHKSEMPKKELKNLTKSEAQKLEKNAFGMFGEALHWEEDFTKVVELKDDIQRLIDPNQGGQMTKGFLNRLAELYGLYINREDDDELSAKIETATSSDDIREFLNYRKWQWRSAYAFARVKRENRGLENELKSLEAKVADKEYIRYLGIAVRWVELLLRESERGNA
jgi:CRISPR-associated protein Csm1